MCVLFSLSFNIKNLMKDKTNFGKITIEIDNKPINITDLPKDQYEEFLNLMLHLRSAYIAVSSDRE